MLEIGRLIRLVVRKKRNRQAVGPGSKTTNVQREGILIFPETEERRRIQGISVLNIPNCVEDRGNIWPTDRIVRGRGIADLRDRNQCTCVADVRSVLAAACGSRQLEFYVNGFTSGRWRVAQDRRSEGRHIG